MRRGLREDGCTHTRVPSSCSRVDRRSEGAQACRSQLWRDERRRIREQDRTPWSLRCEDGRPLLDRVLRCSGLGSKSTSDDVIWVDPEIGVARDRVQRESRVEQTDDDGERHGEEQGK